jgi:hypothetical protein
VSQEQRRRLVAVRQPYDVPLPGMPGDAAEPVVESGMPRAQRDYLHAVLAVREWVRREADAVSVSAEPTQGLSEALMALAKAQGPYRRWQAAQAGQC